MGTATAILRDRGGPGGRRGSAWRARALAALQVAALAAGLSGPASAQVSTPSGAGMRPPASAGAPADTALPDEEAQQVRWQLTWIRQRKNAFTAAYSGPNSVVPDREHSYSLTQTIMAGWRPWQGGELYLNPEIAAGVPLSNLSGFGGFPNGELARTSGAEPTLYLARLFLRQTWGFGGGRQAVDSDQNQLGGAVDARRLVLTAGVFPLLDVFDDNAYSHDARTQFMNWSLVTLGSYDFAADARGYSRGAALEWFDHGWALRAGRFAMPIESNGLALNPALGRSYGDQVEFEKEYSLLAQPGKVRAFLWRNRAVMGRFDDAIRVAATTGGTPSLAAVRRDQTKGGWGLNVEQSLGRWGGLFLRTGRSDGGHETYAYTEIDDSLSAGVLLAGANWGRAQDSAGLGVARNGLSASHRAYLAAGGLGFFLGDGRLNYRPEQVLEAFYAFGVWKQGWLSLNLQHVRNPGYNADRGPLTILGIRLHTHL